MLVPPETRNVSLGKPVSSTDDPPLMGNLGMVTDGNKGTSDDDFLELDPGVQYAMIDLGARYEIDAICLWHYVRQYRVYFDVIVQVADDPEMTRNVTTLFNNDMDDSVRLGLGQDKHYVDTHFGMLIDVKGVHGRYVRLYSNGNSTNDLNHYAEVEVHSRPRERSTTISHPTLGGLGVEHGPDAAWRWYAHRPSAKPSILTLPPGRS